MAAKPLRLAILVCDDPLDATRKADGGHFGLFTTLLNGASALPRAKHLDASSRLQLSAYDAYKGDELPTPDSVDAVLISGSRFSAGDDEPWIVKLVEYTKNLLTNTSVRVIGVCFGHQIVGRALGAPLKRNENGWEVAVTPLHLTPKGAELFGVKSLSLHCMNKDIVASYPAGVEPLLSSDKTAVHGMYIPKKLFTVQGHPEFIAQYEKELLKLRNDSGVIDDETFANAMSRVDNPHNGLEVGQAFLIFLFE